ncbi:[protein-PII] uridylyltransferase [Egicoccus sp. AB-alg2]|uniref:[protein-PII] uridylyltransferase n=1 Tax=Egicoccus sp. AB-alg2 TaxID=3242693 RepID=UPI00359E240B
MLDRRPAAAPPTPDHGDAPPAPAVPDEAAAVADWLRERGEALRAAGPPPGRAWCEAWSGAVDQALCRLAARVVDGHRLSVVAVGGYGRRELCPTSDVDLLLLHDRLEQPALEFAVREIVYPLWDAGLRVGYAVRNRREAIGAVDDVDTATSMLDLRTVAGDRHFTHLVQVEVLRRLRQRPHRFLEALRRADVARRRKAGDAAEALEPDLKNGAGGLRDVQSLAWAAAALVGVAGLDPLVPAGYLGAADRPRLVRARDRLLAARVALHLVTAELQGTVGNGTRNEVLRLELQDAVAARLGYEDRGANDLAAHDLLRELFLAARTVDHVHRRAWSLIDADRARGARRRRRPTQREHDGFELVDGVLRLPEGQDLAESQLPSRLFTALADTGAVLDRASAARLRRRAEEVTVPWPWSDQQRERFVRVLWRGQIMLPALAELDDVGVLGALLPEWEALRGRPQRNPYHRYSLDRHAWHAAAHLGDLVRREPWAAEARRLVGDREGLLLGVLLHDVGKAVGEPHSETGIPLATAIAARMGASAGTIGLVGRLVRLHLLLPDAARKRDVTDPELVRRLASEVGDRSTLACLHLLSAADGLATGPTAWTTWTASLVHTLITKVSAVLEEQDGRAVSVQDREREAAVATVREAQRLAPELGADAGAVREHLALLPTRYARSVSPRAVVRHTLMTAVPPGPTEVRTRVTPGEDVPEDEGRVDELDVVALDHPGWFAKVAGVVALHAGSILAADAFSREDGLAVDTFKVRPPEGAAGAWWAAVEGDLAEAAAGKLAIRARVLRQARAASARLRGVRVPTTITSEPDPAGRATLVEVHTLDRVGVLYSIATALAELELDIVVARIQTLGREAVDVFAVRDGDGRPLDEHHLAELRLAVDAAIEELGPVGAI